MTRRRKSSRVLQDSERVRRPFPEVAERFPKVDESTPEDPVARALDEARKQGYREGRCSAEEVFEQEIEEHRREMARTLESLQQLQETLTRQHEALLLDVALEAASRIVRQRIEEGDPVAARALEEALDALPSGAGLRARLNPEDLQSASELLHDEIALGRIELVSDPGVSRGGTVVESEVGTLDASLETAEKSARGAARGGGDHS